MDKETEPTTSEEQNREEQFLQRLLQAGLLTEITPRLPPEKWPKNRTPIPIEGKPISEIIIEERR